MLWNTKYVFCIPHSLHTPTASMSVLSSSVSTGSCCFTTRPYTVATAPLSPSAVCWACPSSSTPTPAVPCGSAPVNLIYVEKHILAYDSVIERCSDCNPWFTAIVFFDRADSFSFLPGRCTVMSDLRVITFDGNNVALYDNGSYILVNLPQETIIGTVEKCPTSQVTLRIKYCMYYIIRQLRTMFFNVFFSF